MSLPPLVLVLEFARAAQVEDPFAFRFVPQDYQLRTPSGGFERAELRWDDALAADLTTARLPDADPVVLARLGERLRQFVTPLGWPELAAQVLQAIASDRRVLLTIRSAAAELYALPWELLTCKASGQPLGALPQVLLRYEWPDTATTPEQPLPRKGSGRILLAWSAAGGAVPAAEQVAAIQDACALGQLPFDEASDVLDRASLPRLRDTLHAAKQSGRPISVLHILCHGGAVGSSFGLVFDGPPQDPAPAVVDAGRLQQVLAPFADMIRLVVLSACDSGNPGPLASPLGSVAQTLHRSGIACVVASRYPLSVSGSLQLTQALYQRLLCEPAPLEAALLGARQDLLADTTHRDWASIQLYARADDGADSRPIVFRPYQGLAAFDRAQHRFYFGREALIATIWQRCQQIVATQDSTRLLALLAPSGFGKSSVARAGLLAELARRPLCFFGQRSDDASPRTHSVVLKPGAHPLAALDAALAQVASAPSRVVLVDQLEEIYTQCADATERDAFVARLLDEARRQDPATLVLLTLRTDFIGETGRHHPQLNRLLGSQSVLVTAMSEDELRRTIVEPAKKLGRPLDDATTDLLLEQVKGRDGALPLLQFALSQIWEGCLSNKRPSEALQDLGGVGGALAQTAQQIFATLPAHEQATARRALIRLVRLGEGTRDTRRRVSIRDLCGRGETDRDVLTVLRKFAQENARLVTLGGEHDAITAEVTHEALFDHWADLHTWIEQSRSDRGLYDRALDAAKLWADAGKPTGRLWRPPDLDLLRDYQRRKPDDFGPLPSEFLVAAERRQKTERALGLGAALAVLAAVLLAAGIYVEKERQRTQQVSAANDTIRQQLLDTYVERGRLLLFESRRPSEALLWLHRAQAEGSHDATLPDLIVSALRAAGSPAAVLVGHRQSVQSARFSPDGRRIVTASRDHTARVWDTRSGRLIAELSGHDASVRSASFRPDGRHVVTASNDKTARVWDADSGKVIVTLSGHGSRVEGATYSPDGRQIVTASADNTARIWDAESGRPVVELKGHGNTVLQATYRSDGRRIVTASEDGTARAWDSETGRLIAELKGHADIVESATFSPDGHRIVTASLDGTARTWDAENGRPIAELKNSAAGVKNATYNPEGNRVVTADGDNSARLWDAESGRLIAELKGHSGIVWSAMYSPDGRRIVTASNDKTGRIWNAETGQFIAELRGHGAAIWGAAYDRDGRYIVTASDDQTARVWQSESGRLLAELSGHASTVYAAMPSPDGHHIVTASGDNTARLWETESGTLVATLAGHASSVKGAAYSPDGTQIVTTGGDRSARIWAADSGRLVAELIGHASSIESAMYRPDGRRIVTASLDGTARVWDADSGKPLAELKGQASSVSSAAYSPDGRRIVTTTTDHTAHIWDADSGKPIAVLAGHGDSVSHAAFSPDGRRIVTASADKTARIWDADSGRFIVELKGHGAIVQSALYSPDGRRIVTASADNTARVWDAESGRLVCELKGHSNGVFRATYRPDGRRIVTASWDQTARVWDADSGQVIAELAGHIDSVYRATYTPDGRRIATASGDRTARVWDLSASTLSLEQLQPFLRCHVPVKFDPANPNILVPNPPSMDHCKDTLALP